MVRTVRIGIGLLSCLFFLVCCGCDESNSGIKTKDNSLYTRFNLHYVAQRGHNLASYANYTDHLGHSFLPFNTKVETGMWDRGFKITAVDAGIVILFEYKSQNMAGMRSRDYLDLILSSEPISYTDLTTEDEQGLEQGKALVGMTKQGVMIALGYPAKHRTPSLDGNTWTYWKSRLTTRLVQFDGNGKVVSISR